MFQHSEVKLDSMISQIAFSSDAVSNEETEKRSNFHLSAKAVKMLRTQKMFGLLAGLAGRKKDCNHGKSSNVLLG